MGMQLYDFGMKSKRGRNVMGLGIYYIHRNMLDFMDDLVNVTNRPGIIVICNQNYLYM